jgi:hypothetical protein
MIKVSRRMLLGSAAVFGTSRVSAAGRAEEIYRFRTGDLDIEMTIQFFDGYASRGFWFRNESRNRDFCLASDGEEGRDCVKNFRGSLAIAQYRITSRAKRHSALELREHVRTVDHDARLAGRPPFERAIQLKRGIGGDLQAFGYEAMQEAEPISETHGPWYLFRQDLFLEPQRTPFLIVYWKHALSSIRLLDVIPGDQTWVLKK